MLSIVKGPYLQWPTPTGMKIMWETSGPASTEGGYWQTQRTHNKGWVALPETMALATGAGETCMHTLVLEGLEPETLYHYQVRSVDAAGQVAESAVLPLKTAVRPDTPFSFAVTSESGGYGDDQINRRLFPQIQRCRPDFLLMVGDAVQHGRRYEDWEQYFFGPAKALLHTTPFYLERGIVYVVAGGAGAKPDWFHPKRAWHTAQAQAVPHFVQVVVAGTTLELRAIDEHGNLFDTLQLRK